MTRRAKELFDQRLFEQKETKKVARMSLKVAQELLVEGNTLFWSGPLPRLAGKKLTAVIYICLPQFRENFSLLGELHLIYVNHRCQI